jgi:hypothetical protein
VASVGSIPKGITVPELVNQPEFFSLEKDEVDLSLLDGLSEKLREVICAAPEYKSLVRDVGSPTSVGEMVVQEDEDADIPF